MRRADTHILIVDDDSDLRRALRRRLAGSGYRVSDVEDGEQALAVCENDAPHILLLDVSLPGMDGYQVCERAREIVDVADLAVVFLTGTTHAGTNGHLEQLVTQAGGDYFLAKPYDGELLIRLMDEITEQIAEADFAPVPAENLRE